MDRFVSKSIILTLILSCFLPAYALSQMNTDKIKVHPLYLEEEPRADLTYSSVRDKQGFLWVATDNGVKRYDGYHLRVFSTNPNDPTSIGSNAINHLMMQSTGSLWVSGTNLNQYHPETEGFTRYRVSDGLAIRVMHEDKQGLFWFGGEGFGLRCFDPVQGQVVQTFFNGSNDGFITAIIQHGSSSLIWVASSAGLYLFDTQTFKVKRFDLPLDFGVGIEAIRSMAEDQDGNVWMATQEGLLVLNPESKRVKHYTADRGKDHSLKTNTLWSVFVDSKQQVWVGTDKQGVHKYRPETDDFLHMPASASDEYSFPVASVDDIYEDDYGTLWFAVGAYGMRRVSEHLEKFSVFKHNDEDANSLGFNNILDLHEDRNGIIWIATDGGGLDRYDPKKDEFTHYKHNPDDPESISSNSVLSLAEDAEGNIWVGTWAGGLNRLNPSTGKFWRLKRDPKIKNGQTLDNNNVFRIVINKEGQLLLSLWRRGLQIYDPKTGHFESYFPLGEGSDSGVSSFSINDILPTPDGNFWIASYSGLELFFPASSTNKKAKFTQSKLAINEAVYDLHLDKAGVLWLAYSAHFIRYNPHNNIAKHYTEKDGLSDNFVASIEEDSEGYLWLGTRHGLSRFNPLSEEFVTFDESDGLAGSQFNRFSHLKTKSGMMYFGGSEGLSYFDPANLPKNENAPKVHIIDFELFQKSVKPGLSPLLTKPINMTAKLELPYSQKDIAFKFTGLNYISPEKNHYRYRLKGLEDEWVEVDSSRRRVRYTNLAPGQYKFQVLGSNNEGVWNGAATEIALTILPAWWQTWWARCLYGLSALLLMYIFSFWRLRSNRSREKTLKTIVNEQTSKLKKANRDVIQLNAELEQRVEHRTRELSIEIEEHRISESKANYIAFHDDLTGLPNRAWLLKHLSQLVEGRSNKTGHFALFFIGGDRFKLINDTHGHLLGDKLLTAVSTRLSYLLPKGYHSIRLGGDEFTVVADHVESDEKVINLAEDMISAFDKPFFLEQVQIDFSVSIGVIICGREYTQSAQILRNANIAMQSAKDNGRGVYQMFDAKILKQTLDNAALRDDLKQALKRDQFHVVFQPIIIVATGALSGFEVLLRWIHPEKGFIPPDKFIVIAEELGIIFDIGLWVLEQACIQQQKWQTDLNLPILPTIAVNLSPLQLNQTDLLKKFDDVFEKTGAVREKIKFEITETALMENTETVENLLESLRESGNELAIDDFGTGYSSLSYLDKLPVQVLKIDRAFVNALFDTLNNGGAHEIVRATISLAHNLNMRVVAEGIETQEQLKALSNYGCDYAQGYMIAKPLSSRDATEFLINSKVEHLSRLIMCVEKKLSRHG